MDATGWDERYRAEVATGAPEPLLVQAAGSLSPGRALDVACGSGRNALWLAEQGWSVTAVDRSTVGLDHLRRSALERGLTMQEMEADLERREYPLGDSCWDLIIVCLYLQRDLFDPVRKAIAPGGIAVVTVLLGEEETAFRLRPGQLAAYFEGWEILHSFEGEVAELVARRPLEVQKTT